MKNEMTTTWGMPARFLDTHIRLFCLDKSPPHKRKKPLRCCTLYTPFSPLRHSVPSKRQKLSIDMANIERLQSSQRSRVGSPQPLTTASSGYWTSSCPRLHPWGTDFTYSFIRQWATWNTWGDVTTCTKTWYQWYTDCMRNQTTSWIHWKCSWNTTIPMPESGLLLWVEWGCMCVTYKSGQF